jgi:hypothetical protein
VPHRCRSRAESKTLDGMGAPGRIDVNVPAYQTP